MCSSCYEKMEHLQILKNREIFGTNVYCCGEYSKDLQKLIRAIKYHKQKELAFYQANFMYEYWKEIPDKKETYQIVPVPLFKKREKQRKYNHMNLIAEEFSKLSGYDVNLELIERIKDTKPQYRLTKSQRMENLSNAFKIKPDKIKHGRILLLDDICTTGSTFENIIMEFKKHNINDIVCLATTTPLIEG